MSDPHQRVAHKVVQGFKASHSEAQFEDLAILIQEVLGDAAELVNPHFSPSVCCDGPMAHPVWLSLGRAAPRSVGYGCAAHGRESEP